MMESMGGLDANGALVHSEPGPTSHPAASCCGRRAEPSSYTFTARSNVAM